MTDTFDIEQAREDDWHVEYRNFSKTLEQDGAWLGATLLHSGEQTDAGRFILRDRLGALITSSHLRNLPSPAPAEHVVAVQVEQQEGGYQESISRHSHDDDFPADSGAWEDLHFTDSTVLIPRTELTFRDGRVVKQDGVALSTKSSHDSVVRGFRGIWKNERQQLQSDLAAARAEVERVKLERATWQNKAVVAGAALATLRREVVEVVNADCINISSGAYYGKLQQIKNLCQPDDAVAGEQPLGNSEQLPDDAAAGEEGLTVAIDQLTVAEEKHANLLQLWERAARAGVIIVENINGLIIRQRIRQGKYWTGEKWDSPIPAIYATFAEALAALPAALDAPQEGE